MVDRLYYKEESATAKTRATARADEIKEELRSHEAELDETKMPPKLPDQEKREQLAWEKAELRRPERGKKVELTQKPAGKTEEIAAADEETPVKASGNAETTTAVKEVPVKTAELAATPARRVTEKTDGQTVEMAVTAAEERTVIPAAERAVSPTKGPLVEETVVAECRPKQLKLLRVSGSFNALIEGRTPGGELQGAVERLKETQAVADFKRPAAKVKAKRLDVYDIRNSVGRTASCDFVIGEASDLSDVNLSELIQLIAADDGMCTVPLIDSPLQLTKLRALHPEVERIFHTTDRREDAKAYLTAEAKYREAEARRQEEVAKNTLEAKETHHREEEVRRKEEETFEIMTAKEMVEREKAEIEKKVAEAGREELVRTRENNVAQAISAAATPTMSAVKEETMQARTASQAWAEDRKKPKATETTQATKTAQVVTRQARMCVEGLTKLEADKKCLYENKPMTKDAFASYATVYVRNINCVIMDRSVNTLYERIELPQTDNVEFTRKNAETLAEEAADRAEKPSLNRRLSELFSKRYNKGKLLILKERDFLG